MNVTLFAYLAYVVLSVGLTVWVGRTLHKNCCLLYTSRCV